MDLFFDTSAINKFYGDKEPEFVELFATQGHRVIPSALNVAELAATVDPVKRNALLHLLSRLSGDIVPLELPTNILRNVAKAHASGQNCCECSVNGRHAGVWVALKEPEKLDDVCRAEMAAWGKREEDEFLSWHRDRRVLTQAWITGKRLPFDMNRASFLRYCTASDDLIDHFAATHYRSATGVELLQTETRAFLRFHPSWGLWLLSQALAAYLRGIQDEGFGVRNAGTRDLQCAVYLPLVDCFVTDDKEQYRAIRLLNKFNPRRTSVVRYRLFRSWVRRQPVTESFRSDRRMI